MNRSTTPTGSTNDSRSKPEDENDDPVGDLSKDDAARDSDDADEAEDKDSNAGAQRTGNDRGPGSGSASSKTAGAPDKRHPTSGADLPKAGRG